MRTKISVNQIQSYTCYAYDDFHIFCLLLFKSSLFWIKSEKTLHVECHNLDVYHFLYSLPYFETSARTGQNVTKAVDSLLDQVMARMEKTIDGTQFPVRNGAAKNSATNNNDPNKSSKCACWGFMSNLCERKKTFYIYMRLMWLNIFIF